ncbi:spondin domain-containing protein [Psychrobium sp. 1_MG-2023]|nr:spondin domain-containing protein [Psychrobium sp. 1_MG-2023]MDP2561712.1 spondin domain-containing protein [Psychrobium sp. 1_MG-2023]PKF57136.1 hypothetical protein CW748_08480 [Alteromonadales bacterium alter-6D02]
MLTAPVSEAASLKVTITNLTQGIYFTPFLVASHTDDVSLFTVGTQASLALQQMAEGGDISGLVAAVADAGGQSVANPHEGLLAPGAMVNEFMLDTQDDTHLSLTSMLLPTNDGFAGVDSWAIPETAGTYTIMVNAYDAGTEANNELLVPGAGMPGMLGIPADPTMMAGSGGTGVAMQDYNTNVHIHRGSLGDDMMDSGKSDLNNKVHRWLNPVLKVTITVE